MSESSMSESSRQIHRCHQSMRVHVRADFGAPFRKSGTDSSKRYRSDPCPSGNLPEIHDDQNLLRQPNRMPLRNNE